MRRKQAQQSSVDRNTIFERSPEGNSAKAACVIEVLLSSCALGIS